MEILLQIYNMLLQICYCVPMIYAWILYRHAKKHAYLYVMGLFFFYSVENIVICITEFDEQFARIYDTIFMSVPSFRTIIFVGILLFMLLILTSCLEQRINYGLLALLGIVTLSLLFVPMLENSATKVFIYYTPCQIYTFLLAMYGMRQLKAHAAPHSKPVERGLFSIFLWTAVFSILIIVEDWIVIFHFDTYSEQNIHILNRSYTENLMSLYFVAASTRILASCLHSLMLPLTAPADSVTEPAPAPVPLDDPAEPALDDLAASPLDDPAASPLGNPVEPVLDEPTEPLFDYTIASEMDSPWIVSVEAPSFSDNTDYSKFYLFSRDYQLTPREQHILKLLLENKTNIEIGENLYISTGTTKAHVHNIFTKVDVKKRQQLLDAYEHYTSSDN